MSHSVQRNGYSRSSRRKPEKQETPIWVLFLVDFLIMGVCLLVFAYFHHVKSKDIEGTTLPTPPMFVQTDTPVIVDSTAPQEATWEPSPPDDLQPEQTDVLTAETHEPIPTEEPKGAFGAKFAEKFISGQPQITENSYVSENINISITRNETDGAVYFVADIYLRDLEYLKAALANDSFGTTTASTAEVASSHNAILAISGDYAGFRDSGLIIRNGVQYRNKVDQDICVLYYDGTMETIPQSQVNVDNIIAKFPYQAWSFGPMYLDNGQTMETFNCSVNPRNPRSAIGYYEPGHYCFVVVDGRQDGYSSGLTTKAMSQLFYNLGCSVAYNLDGGATAVMYFNGHMVSRPYDGGRSTNDIVYIGE